MGRPEGDPLPPGGEVMSRDVIIGLLVGALIIQVVVIVVGAVIPAETVEPVASSWSEPPR